MGNGYLPNIEIDLNFEFKTFQNDQTTFWHFTTISSQNNWMNNMILYECLHFNIINVIKLLKYVLCYNNNLVNNSILIIDIQYVYNIVGLGLDLFLWIYFIIISCFLNL